MKLNKFAALVKRGGICQIWNVKDSGMWLATGNAVYRATHLPLLHGVEQVRTVLGLTQKNMEKIMLREDEFESSDNVYGLDLTDYHDGDLHTMRLKITALWSGIYYTGVKCDDGELVFFDNSLLAPVVEELTSEYGEIVVRKDARGIRYVIVRDAFDVVAAIMPRKIITREFLGDLAEFEADCTMQKVRDQDRLGPQEINLYAMSKRAEEEPVEPPEEEQEEPDDGQ